MEGTTTVTRLSVGCGTSSLMTSLHKRGLYSSRYAKIISLRYNHGTAVVV
jgi:hypothetical protein